MTWLLVHSSGFPSVQWRRLAPLLPGVVLTPDLPGYGNEPWEGGDDVLSDDADFVIALARQHQDVHLVGHSYGGLVALHAARKAPDAFANISLIEPIVVGLTPDASAIDGPMVEAVAAVGRSIDAGNHEAALRGFFDYWGGEGAFDRMAPPIRHGILAMAPKLTREIRATGSDRSTPEFWANLPPLHLVVSAGHKPVVAQMANRLITAVPGSWKSEVPGEHMCPVTHPAEVAATLNMTR